MLRKGSKARAQRPEQCIGRQLFMGWGSLHSPHLSDVKRVEPWDGRPIVAEMSTKRHKRFRDECSLLGSSGNCCRDLKDQLEPIGQELKETLQRGVPPERIRAFTVALRNISSRL